MDENTRLSDEFIENSEELSPPESKRVRLDDGCNNNLNEITETSKSNATHWSCSGDTSFVEPEILEDMGVSMLEDEESCENDLKKPRLQEPSPTQSQIKNVCSSQESGVYRHSSFDTVVPDKYDRLEDLIDFDNQTNFTSTENESGYGSRAEMEAFVDAKSSFTKDELNTTSEKSNSLDLEFGLRRRKKPSIVGEDKFNKLSDEMILMILKWLPKQCLVRSMLVCKRWCQIARDEALWTRLDLGSKVLSDGNLGHIIPRGVQILRLAQAEIASPVFHLNSEASAIHYTSKLQYLDLSMSVIAPWDLAILISKCKYLKKLSLEKCVLDGSCCAAIGDNVNLEVLNLTMCEGMDVECIRNLMKLKRLTALNLSWCCLDNECMTLVCKSLPPTVTRLNIAGCRKTLLDDNVKDLQKNCPDLVELDLSDCTLLTINTVHSLLKFTHLEHLSLSRCYSIPTSMYIRLAYMPSLMYLDLFGLMTEPMLQSFQANCDETEINKFLYSSVARPTVGVRRTSIWGLRVRD
ncbi:S-phase kinase-associated protein 2 [Leptopilina heterotoma]|uniref:S-phase kinase-associated protein 2 n=1 Tax=Leptopilina heterotoma TaxID=63436 RepID=UPI001CA9004E|nr:S-phase kinase-associated protein 2 [Leptopilina heterotoma]XP_043463039.1 S-phase kinase-associated protein 2 [Leptopilina heterotoma]